MRNFVLLVLLLPMAVLAAPEGRVRLSIDQGQAWWVGQRVLVHLDLMTNGFSFSGQQFDLPQLNGAVLLQTDSTTTKLSETIDGESWQVLRYDLSLFGQRAGEVELPAFTVRFAASMGYGQPSTRFELSTEPLAVELRMPPGADASGPVITSPKLTVTEQWSPDQPEFTVGDALSHSVTIEADDVSAVVLPDPPRADIEGVDVLTSPPRTQDRADRGSLRGIRQSELSYLFTRAGDYSLPGGSLSWWNPDQERLETFQYKAREVTVKPDPNAPPAVPADAAEASDYRLRLLVYALVLVVLATTVVLALRQRSQPPQDSELLRFRRAERACKAGDPGLAWQAINAWLRMAHLEVANDDRAPWEDLQQAVVSGDGRWKGQAMLAVIRRMRKGYLAGQAREDAPLPPLNPR